jgi:hypothetical protein
VVVTVHGEIEPLGCELLEGVLMTDLIDGQGNLLVAVDLAQAVVEPEAMAVFTAAAQRARRRGTKFALDEPPTGTRTALRSAGLADFVEVRTGRASGAVDVSSSSTGASRRHRECRVTPAGWVPPGTDVPIAGDLSVLSVDWRRVTLSRWRSRRCQFRGVGVTLPLGAWMRFL